MGLEAPDESEACATPYDRLDPGEAAPAAVPAAPPTPAAASAAHMRIARSSSRRLQQQHTHMLRYTGWRLGRLQA